MQCLTSPGKLASPGTWHVLACRLAAALMPCCCPDAQLWDRRTPEAARRCWTALLLCESALALVGATTGNAATSHEHCDQPIVLGHIVVVCERISGWALSTGSRVSTGILQLLQLAFMLVLQ